MPFRFVTKQIHAYLDYPVAALLILAPSVLGLGQTVPSAYWLSFVTGFAALILTLFTNHQTGVIKVLPYKLHLAVDLTVGIVFLITPFALGFASIDKAFYVANGLAVLTVVSLSKPEGDAQAAA
jgi:hypothetical protein